MNDYHIPEEDQEFARIYRTAYLIVAFIEDRLSPAEREELDEWVGDSNENLLFFEDATDENKLKASLEWFQRLDMKNNSRRILEKLEQRKAGRRRFRIQLAIAALLVLLAGIGSVYFYFLRESKDTPLEAIALEKGSTLKLADGRIIYLDSMANGTISKNGGVLLVKEDSLLKISGNANSGLQYGFNILSVPRGKQYSIVLADGSLVELNASSVLKFPNAFKNQERSIELTGEAYFQVSKSNSPFTVKAKNLSVTVLGTQFNLNAYSNEENIITTLVEGSVQVTAPNEEAILKPGDQAILAGQELSTVYNADLLKAIAWRNGEFIFRNTPLNEILRTLERWYDIDVENKSQRNEKFSARFNRTWTLERILDYLEQTRRVKFSLKGKKLTVID